MQIKANRLEPETCEGVFNFMSAATQPSLLRNGRVLIGRDPNGNTSREKGIDLEAHTMRIQNARLLARNSGPNLEKNGFELRSAPLDEDSLEFKNHAVVVESYYPQCADLVAGITGARAYAFDHNIRSASGKKARQQIAGGQEVQGPAHLVHGDYTLRSGPDRLHQLAKPPSGNDTLMGVLAADESLISPADVELATADNGRFAIINVWRNITAEPVAIHPMALCDGQTVAPEDLVVFEIHYPDRIGENYFAKYSAAQQMYYYPGMTRDEALLIKQWDSAGPMARSDGRMGDDEDHQAPCTFSFHSAFVDPETPTDAPDRWSIEVRCLVIYDV